MKYNKIKDKQISKENTKSINRYTLNTLFYLLRLH